MNVNNNASKLRQRLRAPASIHAHYRLNIDHTRRVITRKMIAFIGFDKERQPLTLIMNYLWLVYIHK